MGTLLLPVYERKEKGIAMLYIYIHIASFNIVIHIITNKNWCMCSMLVTCR